MTQLPFPLDGIADASGILCPDHLCRTLRGALPGRTVIPFCAAPFVGLGAVGALVLHKAFLHRLDFDVAVEVVSRFAPVYADGAHVLYRRDGPAGGGLPPEMALHLPVVDHRLRHVPLPAPPGAPRRRRALVVSAYGTGNVGDDAVSLAAAQIARGAGFEEAELCGPSWSAEQMDAADLVVVGGGGLLYDINYLGEPEVDNIGNYTAPLARARLLGKPAVCLGLGTQGIATPLGRQAFGHALRTADLLTVRDADDAELLREQAGVGNARLTADLAFALRAMERRGAPPAREGPAGRPLALVALPSTTPSKSGPGGLVEHGAALVRELQAAYDVVLAQHWSGDAAFYAALREATGARVQALYLAGTRAALALYRAASLVVTGRLHGLIFAATQGNSRVVPVGPWAGKLGRLIRHDLPSMRGALLDTSDLGRVPPAEALARAARPAAAEVLRLEARALENIGLLDAALRAHGAAAAAAAASGLAGR